MNLSTATSSQQSIITSLHSPLCVAAGAGSGKTFTLTQRIIYALLSEGGITDISQVLVITFTRKAALELKTRIKTALREEGLNDQALKVDDAWISTIHSMSSRILKQNAFELGIDPNFALLEDLEAQSLRTEAFERVVDTIQGLEEPLMHELFDAYPVSSPSGRALSLESMVMQLLDRLSASLRGFSGICFGEVSASPSSFLKRMMEVGLEYKALFETWQKPKKTDIKYYDELCEALENVQDYFESSPADSFLDPAFDAKLFEKTLFAFPKTSPKYGNGCEDEEFFDYYRQTYGDLLDEAMQGLAQRLYQPLIKLAWMVNEEYSRLKGPDRFDNSDLIRRCYEALKNHPDFALRYQRQFELIMVDEFQDTDNLQIALIKLLSRDRGHNICTVGDAQQSIYRFRGADVTVFRDYAASINQEFGDAQKISLPDNFRSHADVLKIVDAVFSKPSFFGEDFLSLVPRANINDQEDPSFIDFPRAQFDIVAYKSPARIGDARMQNARNIAAHFSRLRGRGVSPSDMVVLLGSLSNASIYIDALVEAGFDCAISGGSVFGEAPEVQAIDQLLSYALNAEMSSSLFQLLISSFFSIDDDTLAMISSFIEASDKRSFARSFEWMCMQFSAQGVDKFSSQISSLYPSYASRPQALNYLCWILGCFVSFWRLLSKGSLFEALREFVVYSGLPVRLEAQGARGQAQMANIWKALYLIRSYECEGSSPTQVAARFQGLINLSKVSPGSLFTSNTQPVSLMTVHASKGLEFEHVAIAELKDGTESNQRYLVENIGELTWMMLCPNVSEAAQKKYKELTSCNVYPVDLLEEARRTLSTLGEGEATSAMPYSAATTGHILNGINKEFSRQEAQRLLYVSMTRAVKSLLVTWLCSQAKDGSISQKGLFAEVQETLKCGIDASVVSQEIDYGGSASAPFRLTLVSEPFQPLQDEQSDSKNFTIPLYDRFEPNTSKACSHQSDRFSYSSLSAFESVEHDSLQDGNQGQAQSLIGKVEELFFSAVPYDEESSHPFSLSDPEKATDLGSVFHIVAERAIKASQENSFVIPSTEQLDQICRRFQLLPDQKVRLRDALRRWFGSSLAKRFISYPNRYAEVPFMISLKNDQGHSLYLEGEIDGLAFDPDDVSKQALLIDYKTGGSPDEAEQKLHAKHLLQAQCYALALLRSGFEVIEACFVRVEQSFEGSAEPQIITYKFTQDDLGALTEKIVSLMGAAQADHLT